MKWFVNYVQGYLGHVTVGQGQEFKINEGIFYLQEVRHIPELKKNLISISKLDSGGYKNQWKINKEAIVTMKGERVGSLYLLSTHVDYVVFLAYEKNDKATL